MSKIQEAFKGKSVEEILQQAKGMFVKSAMSIHKMDEDQANNYYETQRTLFIKICDDDIAEIEYKKTQDKDFKKMPLQNADKFSIFTTFVSIAIEGLSLAGGEQKQCSLEMYGIQMSLLKSVHGKIAQRVREGVISKVIPQIIYDEDKFEMDSLDDFTIKVTEYTPNLRRETDKLLLCLVKIYFPNNTSVLIPFQYRQMKRLADASAKKNKGKANPLYTSNNGQPDEGFFTTKALNFALKYLQGKAKASSFVTDDGEIIPLSVREEEMDDSHEQDSSNTQIDKEVEKQQEAIKQGGIKLDTKKEGELF